MLHLDIINLHVVINYKLLITKIFLISKYDYICTINIKVLLRVGLLLNAVKQDRTSLRLTC